MKNYIVVTGGAGFIGSNLIEFLLKKTKNKIISIDNYSSGRKKNHIKSKRVFYLRGSTYNIEKILSQYKKRIDVVFHFGEFSRIFRSFELYDKCYNFNIVGSNKVFKFCLKNKIKLIYSATSASLGNNGNDKNLSPYSFTKSTNLELLENYKKWFNFKFEIIYFYNVYGKKHIRTGSMATVIGIFEDQFIKNKTLTVVKPGNQKRRFTHIDDTIFACYYAWKENRNRHYIISSKKSYSIMEVAKMFKRKIKFLKFRMGERYESSLPSTSLKNKIFKVFGKNDLKDYVAEFIMKYGKNKN